jgi:hypothetical protein
MAKGTVAVNLKRDWFAPDGSLYQVRDNPHEFPATFAEPASKEQKEDNPNAKYAVLPTTAEILEDATTVAVIQNTGGGQQVIVPTVVEGDVKAVGGALDAKGVEQPAQSVAAAEKGAVEQNLQVGGKPRESGPLPAGTKKPA